MNKQSPGATHLEDLLFMDVGIDIMFRHLGLTPSMSPKRESGDCRAAAPLLDY
jgi:hypothetical protein